ncbi:type II secretion system minor pseudopilin GspK [Caulobacter sp. NIBR1757]|uniref:type II secretion system minor pseudopilin GspK n=1 Tax=Caulobacter sp. NIBR1757 TaxID=3016000 RepID=UPI0022EFF701|nr:type II secretion system minor pseudopilin GspK [Caulobacter sp. NIBR1757]WGM37650.1 Type II secretion system protein K [Caulobacter sp. NIBR1757]
MICPPVKTVGKPHERGVALLTVLLMVAVMSAIAVGVLDDIRFGLRRTFNAATATQGQYFALGAEELARARISRLLERDAVRTSLEGGWNGRPIVFPIENGQILARVSDATGCFNLNSLVLAGGGEPFVRREQGVRQFTALLTALNQPQPEGLADGLAEWMDSNSVGAPGTEDDGYLKGANPYRTASAPLAEVSELRAVHGFTPAVYAAIRPYVCALPTTDLSPVNINTLGVERAVVLTALTEGGVSVTAARSVLAQRPAGGFADLAAFWSNPAFAQLPADAGVRSQVDLRSRFFALDAEVTFAGGDVTLSSLFEAPSPGGVRLVARRWTHDE